MPGLQAVLSRATRGRPKAQPGAFRSSASHQLPPPCQEWERPEVGSLSLPNVSHIYTISMNFPFLPVKVINISFIPKVKVKVKSLSRVRLSATPWTVAQQAPPSMGFSRQEYWSGLPFPFLGDLPDLGIKPRSPALQTDSLLSEPPGKPLKTTDV